ncbi:hypothetical protein C8A00DRAFT_28460 [Chaetomidium leptoderma]|uniref:Xylanolytic transcriptional activator regulatory domain-containing protein n=1 Tax=Chaetomidium leptoderma TaxID=669021 RepID=A0AAN6VW01_9PEZI|nr:hypothetical protein C8A00DRAFT_28460 [Chaetomidium leptoderma]
MIKIIFTTLLAALATVAQAVRLTNSDWNVVAGETFTIGWTDAEGGVSIRLKSGPANSLQTIQKIASGQSGQSFTWTVPTNLDTAQYAIEIEDSSGNINYSVQFPISGDGTSQTTTGSAEEAATTTATVPVATPSTRAETADVSPTPTPATETQGTSMPSEASEAVSETEAPESSAGPTERETPTASTLTAGTTRANRPSATESDVAESGVPNSGTARHSGSALVGAVFGAMLLAEKKIDTIQNQTNQMVKLLSRLTTSNASPPNSSLESRSPMNPGPQPSRATTETVEPISSQAQFEGESSLSAHTAFANNLIERAVSTAPLETFSPDMATTLDALRRLVETQDNESNGHEATYRLARPDPNPGLSLDENPMPPIQSVMGVLQLMKTNPQFESVGFHMYMKADVFVGYIRTVYFPGGGFSAADFIIVNGGLIDVFLRSIFLEEDASKRETLQQHMAMCEANLETALSRLPVHMPNTMDYCLALLVGVNHCMKSSKSSAAWSLVTTALHMCISSGYHRATSSRDDTPLLRKQKSWIFWSLYSAEKGLSLRLGRSSSVSDYDITLPLPALEKADCKPYYSCTIRWIKLSSIQGRVYKMLYSPVALSETQATRTAWAQSLAAETTSLCSGEMGDNSATNSAWRTTGGHQIELVFFSEEVLFLSMLTLILKALPPDDGSSTNFAAECIDTARRGLETHQKFTETIGLDKGHYIDIYVNWTILYNPFMPFIVVFCHVIEVGDPADLARLDGFVTSLETAQHHSEATAKMYRQSKLLYEAALQYTAVIAAKSAAAPQDNNSFEEFDAYIQSLGMPPLGALGNPGNETLFHTLGMDQGMDGLQSVPDMSLGRI